MVFTSLFAEMEAFLRICQSVLQPSPAFAGMSAVGRWVSGRDTGDLPPEVISEISTAAQPSALLSKNCAFLAKFFLLRFLRLLLFNFFGCDWPRCGKGSLGFKSLDGGTAARREDRFSSVNPHLTLFPLPSHPMGAEREQEADAIFCRASAPAVRAPHGRHHGNASAGRCYR